MIDHTTFHDLQAQAGAEFVAELIASFAEEAPRMLDELRVASAAGQAEVFRRAAHSIKSNASTFGATRLAGMARTLELGSVPSEPGQAKAHPDLAPSGALAAVADLEALEGEIQRTIAALHALARS